MTTTNKNEFQVVHFITTIERGGAEKQLAYLVAEQRSQGNKVSLVYFKGKPELESTFASFGVPVIAMNRLTNFKNISQFTRLLLNRNKMVFHAHLPRAEIFCLLVSIVFRKPFVISRHNAENMIPKRFAILSKVTSRIVTAFASTVLAISLSVRDHLESSGEIHDISKLKVVYYGFSKSYYVQIENSQLLNAMSKIDLPKKRIVVLSRLEPQKNLSRLIEAFAPIVKVGSCELLIYGEGSQQFMLGKKIESLGVADGIILMGKTSNIASVLGNSDVFVLPSLYEGFGMVLFEALANNCRIAASGISAIPEVLGSDYPYLFNPENSLDIRNTVKQCLYADKEFFVEFNQKRLKRFPIKDSFLKIDEIYRDSLESKLG